MLGIYLNNTIVSNHFHSVKILSFSSARSHDFDEMYSTIFASQGLRFGSPFSPPCRSRIYFEDSRVDLHILRNRWCEIISLWHQKAVNSTYNLPHIPCIIGNTTTKYAEFVWGKAINQSVLINQNIIKCLW
jgi:hypothetical protein